MPADDAQALEESYGFLRTLNNRLRIERDQPVEDLEREGERLLGAGAPARLRGDERGSGAPLLADYARHRQQVRALYARWFRVGE